MQNSPQGQNATPHCSSGHYPPLTQSELWDSSLLATKPSYSEPLHMPVPWPEVPFPPHPYRAGSVAGAVHTPQWESSPWPVAPVPSPLPSTERDHGCDSSRVHAGTREE